MPTNEEPEILDRYADALEYLGDQAGAWASLGIYSYLPEVPPDDLLPVITLPVVLGNLRAIDPALEPRYLGQRAGAFLPFTRTGQHDHDAPIGAGLILTIDRFVAARLSPDASLLDIALIGGTVVRLDFCGTAPHAGKWATHTWNHHQHTPT